MALTMRRKTRLWRIAIGLLAVATLGTTAACGENVKSEDEGGTLQIWALKDAQNEPIIRAGIEEHNKKSNVKLNLTTLENDAYKQKLQVSMGSPEAPDIFFNWGGGNLAQYVKANQVVDLTSALNKNKNAADAFLPSVMASGKINGKQYGLPMNDMQPVVLFYNKDVFTAAGVQPPKTWEDVMSLVDTFKAKGVIPIALAGSQGWTELMYLEYLLDRVGGPTKFADIAAGKSGAWKDPAVLKSLQMCQELAKRGAFGSNFSSVNYDNNGASRLFATGKAAMHLMGSWEYSTQLETNPEFAHSGSLAWTTFPTVAGGTGDEKNIVGNPSNYFSVRSGGKHTDVAVDFVVNTLFSTSWVDGLIKSGQVPAVKGVESKLGTIKNVNTTFGTFTYKLVSDAPSFTQSWDQALSPEAGTELNSNLQKLFVSQITPDQLVSAMEKVK